MKTIKKNTIAIILILSFVYSNVNAKNGINFINSKHDTIFLYRDASILGHAGDTITMVAISNNCVKKAVWFVNDKPTGDTSVVFKYALKKELGTGVYFDVTDTIGNNFPDVTTKSVFTKFLTNDYVFSNNSTRSTTTILSLSNFDIKVMVSKSKAYCDSIFWYRNDTLVHSGKDSTYKPIMNGVYNIKIKNVFINVNFTYPTTYDTVIFTKFETSKKLNISNIDNTTTNIEKISNKININIYPNPTTDILNVSEIVEYHIFSITGQEILNGIDNKIEVNNLENGTYFLKTKNECKMFIKK